MSNKIIDQRKVTEIRKHIERQIQLRVRQLSTFVRLQDSIEHRMFRGQLLQGDIEEIKKKLEQMPGASETAATDHAAIEAIQHLLDGKEWSADTLGEVANIVKNAGYQVRDLIVSEFPSIAEVEAAHYRGEGEA